MKQQDRNERDSFAGAPEDGPHSTRWGTKGVASIQIGDVVGGHYVVEGVLDEGGMAVVYEARNQATGKAVALKVLQAQLSARPEFVKLFAKEAKVGSLIGDHKHIVDVFDAGLDEERRLPFIVMELLEGETLEYALERGPLPRPVAREIFRQLGDALEQAHRAGVVHRDLKPGNLFLMRDEDGSPLLKVMDFGIAKVLEGGVMRTATQVGTPAYTAPEQMGATTRKIASRQGIKIAAHVSPATDVWALGLLAYEILTGLPPGHYWGAETLSELPMKVAFEDLPPATSRAGEAAAALPRGFDGWFARCLRKNSAERFPTAGEAVAELLALEDPLVVASPPPLPKPQNVGAATITAGTPRNLTQAVLEHESDDEVIDEVIDSMKTRLKLPETATPLPAVSAPTITVAARPTFNKTEVPLGAARPRSKAVTSDAPVVRKSAATAGSSGTPSTPRKSSPMVTYVVGAGLVAAIAVVGWMTYQDRQSAGGEKACLAADASDREAAALACREACDHGSLLGCSTLAAMHAIGDGVKADAEKARELYAQACGVAPEQVAGRSGPGSQEAMRRWVSQTEEGGCADKSCVASACVALAGYYEKGKGGAAENERIATALYKRVCGVDFDDDVERGVEGCVGLARQRQRAGQRDAARKYYNAACDGGVLSGCVGLAAILERGDDRGEGRDEKTARSLYQRACDGGDLKGCTLLGRMVEQGKGGWVKDEPAASRLYKRACDGGELFGCTILAKAYMVGKGGLSKDAVRAAELFRASCEGGEMVGCAEWAAMAANGLGGLSRDEKQAYNLNKQACEGGSLLGCANLGDMFLTGMAGLTKDPKEGRRLIEEACRGGEPVGCLHLAQLELDGGKMLVHEIQALLQNACDDGEPRGCVVLGEMLEKGGDDLEPDLERAAALYRRGCDEGAMRGCTHLANLTYQGAGGIDKDIGRSAELNEKACRGGDEVGCARLAVLYALGEGVRKDRARASELYKDACTDHKPTSESMQSRCQMLKRLIEAPGQEAKTG